MRRSEIPEQKLAYHRDADEAHVLTVMYKLLVIGTPTAREDSELTCRIKFHGSIAR